MKKLYACFLAMLLLILSNSLFSRTFYVSSSTGDDSRSVAAAQNPNTPWKSLARANSVPITSASTVRDTILFKRGDVFIGKLITRAGSATFGNLVYGAYGSGSAPIISGAIKLGAENGVPSTVWTEVGGGIWRRYYNTSNVVVQSSWPISGIPTTAAVVENLSLTALYVNGERRMISRYPNSGYLFVNTAGTNKAFTATDLGQNSTYFTGSKIALRCVPDRWAQLRISVTGSTVNLIDTLEGGSYTARKDAGYYFYGNLNMLDAPGEWYFDDVNDYMYFMPQPGQNPNEMDIEASLFDYNVNTNERSYITIKDLVLERSANAGVYFQNTSHCNFLNLTIRNCYLSTMFSGNGASNKRSTNIRIENCYISDSPAGVNLWRTSNSTFTNNTFKRIGTWHIGYLSTYPTAIGSDLSGFRNTYSYNVIDSMGKNGIRICDSLNIIEKNIISNVGIAAADLAGIYTGDARKSTRDNIIRNNFIFDMRSNTESWKNLPDSYRLLSPGLYNDIYGKNNLWYRNTVYNAGTGILSQNELEANYRENIVYNFTANGMMFIERATAVGMPVGFANKNNIIGNTFYKSTNTNGSFIFNFENQSPEKNWGTFLGVVDNNRYVHAYQTSNYIGIYPHDSFKWLSFTNHWKPKVGDANSKMITNTANVNKSDQSVLFTNMTDNNKTVNLLGTWYDLDGNVIGNKLKIDSWYSKVLIKGLNAAVLPDGLAPDTIAPVVIAKNISIQLNAQGQASITPAMIDSASSDTGGIHTMAVSKVSFGCAQLGQNQVVLTVTDLSGNVGTDTVTVTVEDRISPTVNTKNATIVLVNGTALLTPDLINNGSYDNCEIDSVSVSSSIFSCSDIGTQTITLIVTDKSGNTASKTTTVTVIGTTPDPAIAVSRTNTTFTGLDNQTIALGYGAQELTLTASNSESGGSAVQYSWSPATGLSNLDAAVTTFTPGAVGTYTFNVTATNEYGCSSSESITIKVIDVRCGAENDKILLCHKGDDKSNSKVCINVASVQDHLNHGDKLGRCQENGEFQSLLVSQDSRLNVYPNPFEGETAIEFSFHESQSRISLEVYSVSGTKVATLFSGKARAGEHYKFSFDGNQLAAGTYVIRLATTKKVVDVKQIVKK